MLDAQSESSDSAHRPRQHRFSGQRSNAQSQRLAGVAHAKEARRASCRGLRKRAQAGGLVQHCGAERDAFAPAYAKLSEAGRCDVGVHLKASRAVDTELSAETTEALTVTSSAPGGLSSRRPVTPAGA